MINNKQDCIRDLSNSLARSANWRRGLQAKYNDPRNGRAAEILDQLANDATSLSDEAWSELAPFYNWTSVTWSESVSAASRHVEFRNVNTLPSLIDTLVGILSQSKVAA
jgi:hypothetical protein